MGCFGGKWTPVMMMVGVNAAMGLVNALVKKTLDGGLDHMIIATYRLVISTLFLAPIAYFLERKTRPSLTFRMLCQLFFSALLGASFTQYFILLGLSYTSATITSAFMSMSPAITFILALVFRQETLNMRSRSGCAMMFGTSVCIGGALLLAMYKGVPLTSVHPQSSNANHQTHEIKPEDWILGCVFLLMGTTCFSAWMLLQARINRTYPCPYSSTVILSFIGSIQCALLSLMKTRDIKSWYLTKKLDIMTIVYAGVVGQGICTVGISWCIKQRGPVFTSVFTPLVLIFAALFDYLLSHRQIYLGSVLGSIMVICGLYGFLWGKIAQIKERVLKLPTQTDEETEEEDYKTGRTIVVPMTP